MTDAQKEAWKAGESGLDAANAAPLAPDDERIRLRKWFWVIALLFCVGLGWQTVSKHQAHQAAKAAIKAAPVALPEPPKVDHIRSAKKLIKPEKQATKKIATQAIDTPAIPAISKMETTTKPAEPLTQFDRDLLEFERKIP